MNTSQTHISLDTPGDLIAAVPYLIGFTPHDAVVMIGTAQGRYVIAAHQPAEYGHNPHYVGVLLKNGVDGCVVVGYSSRHDDPVAAQTVTEVMVDIGTRLRHAGIDVADVLLVKNGTSWTSLFDAALSGEAPDDQPIPALGSGNAEAFAAVGATPLPSRESITRVLGPADHADRENVASHIESITERIASGDNDVLEMLGREALELLDRYGDEATTQTPDPREVAVLAITAWKPSFVASAMRRINNGDLTVVRQHVQLWRWVMRHTNGRHKVSSASLFAYVSWRIGDGISAKEAIDMIAEDAGSWPLAVLMARLLADGTPPRDMRLG